jgi:hypothetical protein
MTRDAFLSLSISVKLAIRSPKHKNQQQGWMPGPPDGTQQHSNSKKIDGPGDMGSLDVLINHVSPVLMSAVTEASPGVNAP